MARQKGDHSFQRGFIYAAVFMFIFFAGHRVFAGETVAREITPWWKSGSPYVRAQQRLKKINPKTWSKREASGRTLHISATLGKFAGYGRVRILDMFATADVVHYVKDPRRLNASLQITYEVLEPANVFLRSSTGSAFWTFENDTTAQETVFYSGEKWDIRKKGVFSLEIPFRTWKSYTGSPLAKGVHRFTSHKMFQMFDPETNKWVAACNSTASTAKYPPLNLSGSSTLVDSSYFTVADLRKYKITITNLATDWGKGGFVGARVILTDAAGQVFDIPGAKVVALMSSSNGAGERVRVVLHPNWRIKKPGSLAIEYNFLGKYPEQFFAMNSLEVAADIWVRGPDGLLRQEHLSKRVLRKDLPAVSFAKWTGYEKRKDFRTPDGVLRETRALYISPNFVRWWQSAKNADETVKKAASAGFNLLFLCVYSNGYSFVRSANYRNFYNLPKTDTFAEFVKKARASNLEVHPVIDYAMTIPKTQIATYPHPEWLIVDRQGKKGRTSDIHQKRYQDYVLGLITHLVKTYPVQGINLDYIRTKKQCFGVPCQTAYKKFSGRDLLALGETKTQTYFDWQAETVGKIVKRIRETLKAINPNLKLTTWGRPEPRNSQGRRPDIWLNKGWIDGFYLGCYGDDARGAFTYYRRYASMTKYPNQVWPTLASYAGLRYMDSPPPNASALPLTQSILGGNTTKGEGARRAIVLKPIFDLFRNGLGLSNIAVFDLSYYTDETLRNTKKLIFPEPAVTYFAAGQKK